MVLRTCAAMAAMWLSGTVLAQEAGQQPVAAPAKEKKICRSVTPTGSFMAKRMCLTKSDWAEFNARNDRHNDMFRDNKNTTKQPETL